MIGLALASVLLLSSQLVAQQPAAARATGRLAGRVVDATTGQPLPGAQIVVGTQQATVLSDLDGRYRTGPLPAGRYKVVARRLGLQPKQYDSLEVKAGETALANFALTSAVVSLESVVVTGERSDRATSEAGLLAMQLKAPAVMDGLSAQQISRTPDSDAGQAAARVSGVTIVDNKFVVVRGLSERYSNTLLNGVEIASAEPSKKIVPLDVFPASLLDAVLVTKSGTPDRPADFSGGSVEVRTKEFPEKRVFQFGLSVGDNSRTTGKEANLPAWSGLDFLGFDDGRRKSPTFPKTFPDATSLERFGESLRNTWNPAPRRALPNLGFNVSFGDQAALGKNTLGYVFSVTYSTSPTVNPYHFTQFLLDPNANPARGYVYNERSMGVDWGSIANLSYRVGANHKFGWKNLYTRNAEEQYATNEGFNVDRNGDIRGYQFSYTTRDLLQTQLTGEHLLAVKFPSRLEWKVTFGRAARDEPDNRQLQYIRPSNDTTFYLGPNSDYWFRFLDDRIWSEQADWSVPLRVFGRADATVKTGVLARQKVRHFDAHIATFNLNEGPTLPADIGALTPDRLFVPENIGGYIGLGFPGSIAQPYEAYDDLAASYLMIDTPLTDRIRLVGGVRYESWQLDLYDGGRARFDADTSLHPTNRRTSDFLWSGNLTISLTPQMNLRLVGFQSVARPDTRELSVDEYVDIVGACPTVGRPSLQPSSIRNADARWEWYPAPGEMIAISGFAKSFKLPIIRTVSGDNNCTFTFNNGDEATNVGTEIEVRKGLTFLPGALANLSMAVNAAYVRSHLTIDSRFGNYADDLPLEDQSPYIVNGQLGYTSRNGSTSVTILYNWFDDRVTRYGFRSSGGANATQGPNIVERGRGTVDFKWQQRVGGGFSVSLGGKNLTDEVVEFFQATSKGRIRTGYLRSGRTISLGMTYAP